MNPILINKEPVELYKILKFEGIRASGAEAKQAIAEGFVKVNGELETQKRKKIVAGDIMEVEGESYQVQMEG